MKLFTFQSDFRLFVSVAGAILWLCSAPCSAQTETNITIDPSITYQTIGGWGCATFLPAYLTPEFKHQLIHEVANEYGLNRMRLEPPAGNTTETRRWEWLNDNADPAITDWSALNLRAMDEKLHHFLLPLAELVKANGDPFEVYVSYSFYNSGSSGTVPLWLLNNPAEYLEYAISLLNRMKHYYGIDPTYITVLNEPAYDNNFTAPIVRELAKALGPRMEAAGFRTRIQYPEALHVDMAYNTFISPYLADDDLWSWIGAISYHRYGASTQLANLVAFAQSKGLRTSFTEQLSTGLNLDLLYTDLTSGMNSTWEVFTVGSEVNLDAQHFNYFEPGNGAYYWRFRQIFHYVRPGAVRVATTTDLAGPKVLAFVKDGNSILNFYNFTTSTVKISGLAPGTYGLCSARLTSSYIERGIKTVSSDGLLTLTGLDTTALYTLYPRSAANMAPVFTAFKPSAPYLISPASSFTLTAAAQDPDLNAISYQWTVTRFPAGASVTLATPTSATCVANGLTLPGDYAFNVTATDGALSTQREVRMRVFASNPAPVIIELHNRTAVQLQLPSTTSTLLRSNVFNVDGDTLSYQWTILSQPPGAGAVLAAPTVDSTDVTGMAVAGDYVFRLSVSDGTSTVFQDHTVPVYPANSTLSVTAVASPASIALPASSTQLNSTSSDSDGDVLSHWWRFNSGPTGAKPVFQNQAAANTQITGLIVPGTYSFEHVVSDRFNFKKSTAVTVTVTAGASPAQLALAAPIGGETYEPGQTVRIRWSSFNFIGNVKIEFHDGTNWSTITATTANDGIESWTVPTTPHSACRIRVTDAVGSGLFAESSATFQIIGPEVFKIIRVDAGANPTPQIEWSSLPGGYSYQVLYSDNLADWYPLGNPQVAQTREYTLTATDTNAAGTPRRFYRVVQTPLE
ncbi:MAG: hypothetical protein IPK22_26395 [Verrucomicrobiaceae bacterium]|nr:hypothetical protein [Verrucomicrobiaceae bacterium]